MNTFVQNILTSFRHFHDDEQGIEAVNAVMLLAIAAMVIIILLTSGQNIVEWMKGQLDQITGGGKNIKG